MSSVVSPGHGRSLHWSVSVESPEQYLPPCTGSGLLHSRVLDLWPRPHDWLHSSHGDHSLQPPATARKWHQHRHWRRKLFSATEEKRFIPSWHQIEFHKHISFRLWWTLSSSCKHLDDAVPCILRCCSFYLEFTLLTDSQRVTRHSSAKHSDFLSPWLDWESLWVGFSKWMNWWVVHKVSIRLKRGFIDVPGQS